VKDKDWQKEAICHECGKKGHIRPNCPKLQDEDKDKEATPRNQARKRSQASRRSLILLLLPMEEIPTKIQVMKKVNSSTSVFVRSTSA
jgi:ribosomal protein S30